MIECKSSAFFRLLVAEYKLLTLFPYRQTHLRRQIFFLFLILKNFISSCDNLKKNNENFVSKMILLVDSFIQYEIIRNAKKNNVFYQINYCTGH